jgi:hypothetical protein
VYPKVVTSLSSGAASSSTVDEGGAANADDLLKVDVSPLIRKEIIVEKKCFERAGGSQRVVAGQSIEHTQYVPVEK